MQFIQTSWNFKSCKTDKTWMIMGDEHPAMQRIALDMRCPRPPLPSAVIDKAQTNIHQEKPPVIQTTWVILVQEWGKTKRPDPDERQLATIWQVISVISPSTPFSEFSCVSCVLYKYH
jgi:hypothetical protein